MSGYKGNNLNYIANEKAPKRKNTSLIAFYLPQFHPIPQNDKWWGKGFTEWTNVTKASALFEGHYQPHLPTDFGFYDLRVQETRRDQIRTAKEYGIDGFCYHYYWFSGTRVLNQPIDDMLSDSESDMPFCLCWANENWTRRWDGHEKEILLKQSYKPDDGINFIKDITKYLKDPRYIRINGQPFLIVYRPQEIPELEKMVRIWREYCQNIGIGKIHLCAALTFGNDNYEKLDFDSGVEFPPQYNGARTINRKLFFYRSFKGKAFLYHDVANYYLNKKYSSGNVFRTVFPSWDNTPRSGIRARIVLNATPKNYEYWLDQTIKATEKEFHGQNRFVFINAWNEWAEGCHLEPDMKYHRQFLEATLRAKTGTSQCEKYEDIGIPIILKSLIYRNCFQLILLFKYGVLILTDPLQYWLNKHERFRIASKKLINLLKLNRSV
jgi:lipopolysaccharide biosynthesis protein